MQSPTKLNEVENFDQANEKAGTQISSFDIVIDRSFVFSQDNSETLTGHDPTFKLSNMDRVVKMNALLAKNDVVSDKLNSFNTNAKELQPAVEAAKSILSLLQQNNEKYLTPRQVVETISSPFFQKSFQTQIESSKFLEAAIRFLKDNAIPIYTFNDFEVADYGINTDKLESTPQGKIILIDEINKVRRIITDVYQDNSLLLRIGPRDFEELIAELMRKQGFIVELTKQTRDGGYDILAINSIAGFPLKFLAECKRFASNNPVTVDIIRSFSYVVDTQKANKGIIFTTSYFTKDAVKEKEKGPSKLLDFMENGDIIRWVNAYVK